MEMNTRLQVEHPVTEMVTGLDLVAEQLRAAAGDRLSVTQEQVRFRGHSLECRINAEDPDHNFRPSPGTIDFVHFPGGPGVRMDSHIYDGYSIPTHYDSMIGKIITWAEDQGSLPGPHAGRPGGTPGHRNPHHRSLPPQGARPS